jgi:hypothetical protein
MCAVEMKGHGMRKIYLITLLVASVALLGAGCAAMDPNSGRYDSSERAVRKHLEREAREKEKLRKAVEKKEARERANAEKARKAARKQNSTAR